MMPVSLPGDVTKPAPSNPIHACRHDHPMTTGRDNCAGPRQLHTDDGRRFLHDHEVEVGWWANRVLQGPHDAARIVVGARDVERFAVPTEGDSRRAFTSAKVASAISEGRVGLEPEATGVGDGAEHEVRGEPDRHLVFGADAYARGLGFEPHPAFADGAGHLGGWEGPSAITFGRNGKPFYVS